MTLPYSLALAPLREKLRCGELTPTALARDVLAAAALGDRHHAWIHRLPDAAVLEWPGGSKRILRHARCRSMASRSQ